MLYFELGMKEEDYLTNYECLKFGNFRRIVWNIKSLLGIIVKKKISDKYVYVIPKVNKLFLKKVKKIMKLYGNKTICISDELFYKKEFMNLLRTNSIQICDGTWCIKYMLINILDYIKAYTKKEFENDEIAFLVNTEYDFVLEYLKKISNRFKVITIITNNIKKFSKIEEKYLKNYGININVVNNYKKSLSKSNIIVNIDFSEKEIKKYSIYNKTIFINLNNYYEIDNKKFEGININRVQIAMPDKYILYSELFYNFNYMNVYESFIKKRTSISNIMKEIEKDNLKIICLENNNGIIKYQDFLIDIQKILDK